MSSYASSNVRMTNEKNKRKIPVRASHGLKWENKMYKLKRSITELSVRLSNENKIIVYTNPHGDNFRKINGSGFPFALVCHYSFTISFLKIGSSLPNKELL